VTRALAFANPLINAASLEWAKMPQSVSTNRTLTCVQLFCLTGISMFIIITSIIIVILYSFRRSHHPGGHGSSGTLASPLLTLPRTGKTFLGLRVRVYN
jgi:hypothetical protein